MHKPNNIGNYHAVRACNIFEFSDPAQFMVLVSNLVMTITSSCYLITMVTIDTEALCIAKPVGKWVKTEQGTV